MATPKGVIISIDNRQLHENNHKSCYTETTLIDQDYDGVESLNDTYDNGRSSFNNYDHNLSNNRKYCSTPNIQKELSNTTTTTNNNNNGHENYMSETNFNCYQDITPSKSSSSALELPTEVMSSEYDEILTQSNYKIDGNKLRNQKFNNNTKQHDVIKATDDLQYESVSSIHQKMDSHQQNRKHNNQMNYESISSTMCINHKLKVIQGSTDIQNSMFHSKISSSLNNLQSKLQKNQQQHQEQGKCYRHLSNQTDFKYTNNSQHKVDLMYNSNNKHNDVDTDLSRKVTSSLRLQRNSSVSSPLLNYQTTSVKLQDSEQAFLNPIIENKGAIILTTPQNNHDRYKHKQNVTNIKNNHHNGLSFSHLDKLLPDHQVHNRFNSLSAITNNQSRLSKFNGEHNSNLHFNSTIHKHLTNKLDDSFVLRCASNIDFSENHRTCANSNIPRPNGTVQSRTIKLDSAKISNFIDQYQSKCLPRSNHVNHQQYQPGRSGKLSKHYSPLPGKPNFNQASCHQNTYTMANNIQIEIEDNHDLHHIHPPSGLVRIHKMSNGTYAQGQLRTVSDSKSSLHKM
ncbi:unnamed protein product [Heterobilharzia americana]|nr:unnamed protein product [Heterobilharzia americana]